MTARSITNREHVALCEEAGFLAARVYNGAHIVLYKAEDQGLDVGGAPYAVVCKKHGTINAEPTKKLAQATLRYPEFCEGCMGTAQEARADAERHTTINEAAREAEDRARQRVEVGEELRQNVRRLVALGLSAEDIRCLVIVALARIDGEEAVDALRRGRS